MKRHVCAGAGFLALFAGLGLGSVWLDRQAAMEAAPAAAVQAPRFEVDPLWPKPLPNKWILGQTIGVSVDAQDHVWIIHRAGSLEPGEVHATTNPRYHGLLKAFEAKTGCGVVVNTSFNVRGEPIVCSPADAYRCFMRTEIDVLVLENCLLQKADQKPLEDDTDWRKEFELD